MTDSRSIDFSEDESPLIRSGDPQRNRAGRPRAQQRPCAYCLTTVLRPCLAELVGVCMFVFIGSLSTLSNNIVAVALGHGFTIAILIMAFGNVSGAHLNPCVTLGVTLGGGVSPFIAVFFVCSQLIGATLGSALVLGILPESNYTSINGGIPSLGSDVTLWQGIQCEATLTFLLVLMVLMTAVDAPDNALAPLAIGLSVAVDILAGGSISGAVMNPARAFGPSVVSSLHAYKNSWSKHYIYWVGPIIGSTLAVAFYRLVLGSSRKRLLCPGDD